MYDLTEGGILNIVVAGVSVVGVAEIRLFLFVDANYARFRRVLCMMWSIILPCIFSHFSAHPHRYLITGNTCS